MVLIMKADKNLIISKQTKLLQQENAVDKIVIYVTEKYENIPLDDFTATFYYVDPANNANSEVLTKVESTKEGFLQYQLPVDTKITAIAGNITGHISFTHIDQETNTKYVLHSQDVTITIDAWEDYFRFYPSEGISAIDDKMLEIDNEIQRLKTISNIYAVTQVDDLTLSENHLQVSAGGVPIGDGVQLPASDGE